MAIVQCPSCNCYIDASLSGCTQCGQSFSEKPPVRIESKPAPQPTQIGALQKDTLRTGLLTLCGMVLTFCGLFFFPLLIAGGFILLKVTQTTGGYHQVCCPNCRRPGTIKSKATSYRCPSCSEESRVIGSHLFPHIRSQLNDWHSADEEEDFD